MYEGSKMVRALPRLRHLRSRQGDPFRRRFRPGETIIVGLLFAAASFAIVVSAIIIWTLVDGSWAFFGDPRVTLWGFLTGTQWSPTSQPPSFGVLPLAAGTLLIAGGSLLISAPLGISAAIYMSEFAGRRVRAVVKPVVEVLAGIPSVVYGFFALLAISPFFQEHFGASYFNAISAIIVMAIMILPIIVSISDDAMRAVPMHLREASLAMGATRWETATRIVMPAASSGISASIILGLGRALGETMVVTLAAGSIPNLTLNPLHEVMTFTSFIAQTATGDIPPGIGRDSAIGVALLLFFITYLVNSVAGVVVERIKRGSTVRSTASLERRGMLSRELDRVVDGLREGRHRASGWVAGRVPRRRVSEASMLRRRYLRGRLGVWTVGSSLLVAVLFLVYLIYTVLREGLPTLTWRFVTSPLHWQPELAGIRPVIIGSVYLIGLTMLIALPVGVGAAVYLNEFAHDTVFTRFLRRIIQNLAGVPSIVFGLVGYAAFAVALGWKASLLSGAMTLAIMVLPIIVVATVEALRSFPFSFREAARSVGATRWQSVRHHVLPNATPGIVTGAVLSLSRALGETAPIMFIAQTYMRSTPSSVFDPFVALPMHIFYWTKQSKVMFHDLAASTIIVLLAILLSMNAIAIVIRLRAERRRDW
jgi:phosphate transport system permease protein